MLANINDNQFIYLEQVTQGSEDALIEWFSVREPNSYFMQGRGYSNWDGWYRRYHTTKQRLALPFLDELKRCCKARNIPLEIRDNRPATKYPSPRLDQITADILDGIALEDYQVRALKDACSNDIGVINATTGSGKTELICALVQIYRCPTVILTEQLVVLDQIVERLRLRKVVHGDDIGMFCHGSMPDGNLVIVGSIQSVSTPTKPKGSSKLSGKSIMNQCNKWLDSERKRRKKNIEPFAEDKHLLKALPREIVEKLISDKKYFGELDQIYVNMLVDYCNEKATERKLAWYQSRLKKAKEIQALIKQCDMCLVDECDLATSQPYARFFKYFFKGRRRYGFSGTPYDKTKPVRNMLLREHLGNIISRTDRREVERSGRIIPVSVYVVAVGQQANKKDARAYDIAIKEEIIENDAFHRKVAKIVEQYKDEGTLILVETAPVEPLGRKLEDIIPNSKFIFGKTPKKKRHQIVEQFENRELKCLIGSKILKRGFDLKGGCENLIIIGGGKAWSDWDQKLGRAVRQNNKGKARVFGFFFFNNKYLYKHSREFLKAVVNMGYPSKLLVGGSVIDGEKLIKSRFRLPKGIRA